MRLLRGDLAQLMSMRTLENVWYFAQCEPELLRAGAPERLGPVCKPLVQARAAKREVVEVLDDAADEEEVVDAPSPRQPRRRSRAR